MVAENLEQVRKNIELACRKAGRDPKEVYIDLCQQNQACVYASGSI